MSKHPYDGKRGHSGNQIIKSSMNPSGKRGKPNKLTGKDLRSGKK